MKKFLLFFALAVLSLTAHAFVATPSVTLNGRFGAALRGSSSEAYTYWASYEVNGTDVTYVIYDYDFPEPDQTFTLKNVLTDTTSPAYLQLFGTDHDVIAVRNVFTKDNERLWCVILYDNSNGKYYIYNENGEKLGELPTSEEGYIGALMMSVIEEGPAVYVTLNDKEDQYTVWSFDESNSRSEIKASPSKVNAYPNPLPSGQILTVELSNPADENTTISVVDLNGKQLLRKKVNANQSVVEISDNMLNPGVNVYTVIYGDGNSYTGKIVKE